jgi:hypothetical protein
LNFDDVLRLKAARFVESLSAENPSNGAPPMLSSKVSRLGSLVGILVLLTAGTVVTSARADVTVTNESNGRLYVVMGRHVNGKVVLRGLDEDRERRLRQGL